MRTAAIVLLAVMLAGTAATTVTDAGERGRRLSVRFPAFSLSPGERIMGVRLKAPGAHPVAGWGPNHWTCDQFGDAIHCYCMHPTYATALSGMIPEFFLTDPTGGSLTLTASVELIDNDGKEYTREISARDLIVK